MRTLPVAALVAILALVAGGCGGGSSSKSGSASSAKKVKGKSVRVKMTEFKFQPAALKATPGRLKITAKNTGKTPHELVLLRTSKKPGSLKVRKGRVSESTSIGKIAEQRPGQSGSHTFRLKKGTYVYVCNIPGHYKAGMYGSLVVK
jgi:plastocyanin